MSFFEKFLQDTGLAKQEAAAAAEQVEEVLPQEEPEPELPEEEPVTVPSNITVIGRGTVFTGNITTDDDIEIRGTVNGDIKSSAAVKISSSGRYFGDANVANLNIDGFVDGRIVCDGKTEISEVGEVQGSLTSSELLTKGGAIITGQINLKPKFRTAKPMPEPKPAEPETAEADEQPVTEADLFA